MNSINLGNTLVLNYNDWYRICKYQVNVSLNELPIHDYDYIVGPHYYLKKNHWVAIIIDIKSAKFQLIHPLGASEKTGRSSLTLGLNITIKEMIF